MLRLSLCMAGVCSGWSQVLEGPVWFITGHSLTSVLASILFFFFVISGLFENICFRVLSAVIYHVYSAGGEKIQFIL